MKDLERIRLNAIIHGQRENLRELNEIRDILKKEIAHLQEQLNEANEVIKHYANDENWCDYYDDDDEKMTKAIYIDCNGALKASLYLEKWGVK